jgi:hypothetical protein
MMDGRVVGIARDDTGDPDADLTAPLEPGIATPLTGKRW